MNCSWFPQIAHTLCIMQLTLCFEHFLAHFFVIVFQFVTASNIDCIPHPFNSSHDIVPAKNNDIIGPKVVTMRYTPEVWWTLTCGYSLHSLYLLLVAFLLTICIVFYPLSLLLSFSPSPLLGQTYPFSITRECWTLVPWNWTVNNTRDRVDRPFTSFSIHSVLSQVSTIQKVKTLLE